MSSDWYKFKRGSDIRGDEALLSDEFAEALGFAFVAWLARRYGSIGQFLKVAVGRDSRASGPRLKDALIRGIEAGDAEVMDCNLCTTPAMLMLTTDKRFKIDGAVMVTASHHPAEKNGFKLMTAGKCLTEDEVEDVLFFAGRSKIPSPEERAFDYISYYTDSLAAMVRKRLDDPALKPLLGLRVVVDAGNGAGGFYAKFLEDLGVDVEGSQFLEPDGSFPHHLPDPENRETMKKLADAVIEYEADLGVIFDADCDQVAIVDEKGRAINRNRLIAMIAAILLEENPGATFVTDSVTSSGLARFITEWGGTHYRFKRGYRNVIDEAVRLNEEGIDCPLAIETSGHAAFRENNFLDDGMYLVTRLICEAMNRKREGETLSMLIDELQEPVESAEIRMNILSDDLRQAAQDVIEVILSHTLDNPAWRLAADNREGVRIIFDLDGGVDNAWFLLRMSVHDPVMPLNAESDVPGGVRTMLGELYALLKGGEVDLDLEPLRAAIEM